MMVRRTKIMGARCLAVCGFLALLVVSTGIAFASERRSIGFEPYGISDTTQFNAAPNFTITTHHRLGNDTGIGSSTLQTTSATSESSTPIIYEPTASSSPVFSQPTDLFGRLRMRNFSTRMTDTALLAPTLPESASIRDYMRPGTGMSSFLGLQSDLRPEQNSSTRLDSLDWSFTKPRQSVDFFKPLSSY